MVRYAQQNDNYSCGPTAVINALKHFGLPCSYREEKNHVSYLCGCEPPHGTGLHGLDRGLRAIGAGVFDVLYKRKLSIKQMETHLKNGGAIVIRFYWETDSAHYALITKCSKNGKYFYLVNSYRGTAVRRFSRERFKKEILRFRRDVRCWLLKNQRENYDKSWKNI